MVNGVDQEQRPTTSVRKRRTQHERTDAAREKILSASVACLISDGYHGATTVKIAARARVSRGAILHHFPTRGKLFEQTLEYLANQRLEEFEDLAPPPDGADRALQALDILWSSFRGDLFAAVLELWVAARSDQALREALQPIEREIGHRSMKNCRRLFGAQIAGGEDFTASVYIAIDVMRGMRAAQIYAIQPAEILDVQWALVRPVLARMFA